MRSLQLSAFLALLAACAVNASVPKNELDFDLILSRQAGTPKYECHQNCGSTILGGQVSGYCNNSTWVAWYEACLDCALDFDIWSLYGSKVEHAAKGCGLNPVPSPSGDAGSAPSAIPSSTPSSTPSPTGESGALSTSGSGSAAPSDSMTTTAPPSGTGTGVSSPSGTSPVSTAAAPGMQPLTTFVSVGALAAAFVMVLGPW